MSNKVHRYWIIGLGGPVLICALTYALSFVSDTLSGVAFLGGAAVFLVMFLGVALQLRAAHCPNCGQHRFTKGPFLIPLSSSCVHCGYDGDIG